MSSLLEQASLVVTPNGTKASKLYSVKPTDGSGDMTVVRATTATRVNSSGLIESVATNVPRLDYTGSTCPSILVEPQRTNLLLRSEEFDNAIWAKTDSTVTANATTSPSGTMTADKLVENNTNSYRYILQTTGSLVVGNTYFMSIYLKEAGRNRGRVRVTGASSVETEFNLQNGTVSLANAIIQNMGNGWYRVGFSFVANATTMSAVISLSNSTTGNSGFNYTYLGDNTSGLFLWGAQLEAGANATSYIPTTTATVTRNADVISKTGISDLIGQTEGTIFAEVNFTASNLSDRTIVNLSDDTTANWIFIRTSATVPNGIRFRIANGGALQFDYNSSAISTGVHKLCLSYKLNNISAYIDGVKVSSSTTATIPATSKINIGCMHDNLLQFNDRIKSALLFKTQLTDQECINLTTI